MESEGSYDTLVSIKQQGVLRPKFSAGAVSQAVLDMDLQSR
jgi:hypothetical protein